MQSSRLPFSPSPPLASLQSSKPAPLRGSEPSAHRAKWHQGQPQGARHCPNGTRKHVHVTQLEKRAQGTQKWASKAHRAQTS
jgi:hypothetical protein